MPADRVCRLLAFIFEGHACRLSLPDWLRAFAVGNVVIGCVAQRLLQYWHATTDLRHDREGLFAIIRKTAISCLIAIPACGGVVVIEIC